MTATVRSSSIKGFEQSDAGSGHLMLTVLNRKKIDKVDQCFQSGHLAGKQVGDRRTAHLVEVFDDRQGQRLLGLEVKVHCPFGELGLCQDVIEADHAVGAAAELARCGGDEPMTCGAGPSFAGLRHQAPCLVATATQRRDRFAPTTQLPPPSQSLR